MEAPWVLRRDCEDGSVKGTIEAVPTPQMPKQVWQSEDGKVFESEEECVAYEGSDPLLRLLFNPDGTKRVWDDEYDLDLAAQGKKAKWGFTYDMSGWQALKLLWKSVRYRYELIAMAPHLLEVAQALTKLKDAYPDDDNEPQFDFD